MGRGRFNGGGSDSFDFSCEQQNQLRLRAKCTGDDHSSVKLSAPQPTSSKISLLLWTVPLPLRCCSPSRSRFNESLTPQQLFSFVRPGDVQCMANDRIVPFSQFTLTVSATRSLTHTPFNLPPSTSSPFRQCEIFTSFTNWFVQSRFASGNFSNS